MQTFPASPPFFLGRSSPASAKEAPVPSPKEGAEEKAASGRGGWAFRGAGQGGGGTPAGAPARRPFRRAGLPGAARSSCPLAAPPSALLAPAAPFGPWTVRRRAPLLAAPAGRLPAPSRAASCAAGRSPKGAWTRRWPSRQARIESRAQRARTAGLGRPRLRAKVSSSPPAEPPATRARRCSGMRALRSSSISGKRPDRAADRAPRGAFGIAGPGSPGTEARPAAPRGASPPGRKRRAAPGPRETPRGKGPGAPRPRPARRGRPAAHARARRAPGARRHG